MKISKLHYVTSKTFKLNANLLSKHKKLKEPEIYELQIDVIQAVKNAKLVDKL